MLNLAIPGNTVTPGLLPISNSVTVWTKRLDGFNGNKVNHVIMFMPPQLMLRY